MADRTIDQTARSGPIKPQRLHRLLKRMIDVYSPSGKEDGLVDYLHGFLKRHGLPVIRQEVDEYRDNLIVSPAGEEAELALVGHLDTVSAYDLDEYGFQDAIDTTYEEFYNDKLKEIEDELIEEGYERERTENS